MPSQSANGLDEKRRVAVMACVFDGPSYKVAWVVEARPVQRFADFVGSIVRPSGGFDAV